MLGLSKERIENKVELEMKKAGIDILAGDEWLKSPDLPMLVVDIEGHDVYEGILFAASIDIYLKQGATLVRTDQKCWASTWNTHVNHVVGRNAVDTIDTVALPAILDKFVLDYQSANSTHGM